MERKRKAGAPAPKRCACARHVLEGHWLKRDDVEFHTARRCWNPRTGEHVAGEK